MEPGHLVEFFEEKRILLGAVLELKGERLHILTAGNREMTLARKRVLHASASRLSGKLSRQQWLDALEETARRREALKEAVNLEELWEVLADEDGVYSAADLAELSLTQASPDHVAAVSRALYADGLLFKNKDGLWAANPPEVVEGLREKRRREEEARLEMEAAAHHLRQGWETGAIDDPAWRERLVRVLRQMAVLGEEAADFARGKAFLDKARLPVADTPFKLLVRLGVFHEDENLDLHRLEVPTGFSAEVQELAAQLRAVAPSDPYAAWRADLTHLECFTIDGERTRDFDDALSLEPLDEGWRLGVHIADVSALVQPDSPLDREARERATSIYLPEMRLPMLPEAVSEDTLSLVAGEERPALSFLVTLDADARILDWEIAPSLIRVQRRLTYHQVDDLLPGDDDLAALFRLMAAHRDRRLEQGGYELKLPEVWVNFGPGGEITVSSEDQQTASHELVAEAMVLANFLAARFLAQRGAPAIYRAQPEPREAIDTAAAKDLLALWQDRRRLSRVVMDLTPQPHWGLGLEAYTFATSPIRRYLDLVIHRQIMGALTEAGPVYGPEELGRILTDIEPAMRRAGALKTRRLRYWLLKYLSGHTGEKMEALVLEALPYRYKVLIPPLLLEASLTAPASLRLKPGDLVQVRLDKALPREDQLKLSLA
ncbi:MAG: VacB/RNase II family 3'-5' exoribonuclease [Deltaproteobacteria bacterium]|nr:VacB/RNase II family 3'-5' exoribonuclease [Deltaproteobacteria bacterium]